MDERRTFWAHPELDCVRNVLSADLLAAVARRAREVGVGGGRVLAMCGLVSEEDYLRAIARQYGLAFDTLQSVSRADCPASDAQLVDAFVSGLLVFREGGRSVTAVVPRALASRRLRAAMARSADYPRSVRLTSDSHLFAYLVRHAGAGMAERSIHALARRMPAFSAVTTRRSAVMAIACAVAALVIGVALAPQIVNAGVGLTLSAVFLAWSGLRLWSAVVAPDLRAVPARCRDSDLPTYTIIVALHDEANVVGRLVAALDRLDYPPEKLDIKLVLEEDDAATRAAVAALNLRAPYQVLCAPACGPRTKPKALNAALLFALGRYTAVYDAEDDPEPDQLRKAVDCFRAHDGAHDGRLACVQARLTIDNARFNCLTRLFAAEYAGLFDVFLPGLARYRLPLPLGGSSNHFDTAVLREVGGWDPYNVTEDADLGMRLARFGYHAAVIAASTREEAPPTCPLWFRQRTRWFKGWMQTWLVHMRAPVRLWRDLGASGFLVFQLVVGGTVLAALVHPVFFSLFAVQVARGEFDGPAMLSSLYGLACLAGYLTYGVLGGMGLSRRGLFAQTWILLLAPVYWLLLSGAAWRALYQLVSDPFRWEKTAHGLGRTSPQE